MGVICEMLIGLPASGKSTYSEKIKRSLLGTMVTVISSDAIREECFGSVNDQTHNAEVFAIVEKRAKECLKNGGHCIIDATNLSRKRRIAFLKNMPACEKRATVFVTPIETCLERNEKRDRTVPKNVMIRMFKNFQPPHYAEGFSSIQYINYGNRVDLAKTMIKAYTIPHDNHHHRLTCGTHCLEAGRQMYFSILNNLESEYNAEVLTGAALYHDIGKPVCKVFTNAKGEPTEEAHFYGHENVSAYIYLSGQVADGTQETEKITEIANLIALHMEFFQGEKRLKKIKDLYGEDFYNKLELVHKADVAAH